MRATHQRTFSENYWPTRRQGVAYRSRARENRCCAIAVMNIAVHGHRSANLAVALHAANCHRHVMNHAESFAMVWKCVMKSSADVDCHPVFQCLLCGQNGAARSEPKRVHQLGRVRNLKLQLLMRGQGSGLELVHILWRVDEQN